MSFEPPASNGQGVYDGQGVDNGQGVDTPRSPAADPANGRVFAVAHLVLVDLRIPGADLLVSAAQEAWVLGYDGASESAADVLGRAARLGQETGQPILSLSVVSHGAPGSFALGSDWISLGTLPATAEAWTALRPLLAEGAAIHLFGCQVADGSGQDLLDALAELTGVPVYGSDDITGAGGDWDLEIGSAGLGAAPALAPLAWTDAQLLDAFPTTLAAQTLYLVGDGVPLASLSPNTPTDTVLPNFDPDRDAAAGLLIAKGGAGPTEADPTKHQMWISTPGPIDLNGPASLTIWSATQNFEAKREVLAAFLLDSTADGSSFTVIAAGQINRDPWSASGTFVEDTISFGFVNRTIAAGRSLAVKIIIPGNATEDMWFAYDTMAYPSRLDFTTASTNSSPTTSGLADVAASEDAANTVIDLFAAFADAEDADSALTYAVMANSDPSLFTSVSIDGALGTLTLDYAPDRYGTTMIRVRATDTGGLFVETEFDVEINPVNDAPVAAGEAYAVDEDTTLVVAAAGGVLANDTDIEGDPLQALLVAGPANGSLALGADGSFTYTPSPHYFGPDSFTYRARDGQDSSNTATVSITVNGINDAPVATSEAYLVDQGSALSIPAAGVLANDTDVEGDVLSAVLVTGPTNAVLFGLAAGGGFDYTPNPAFSGSDSFTYRPSDGAALGDPVSVTITVNPAGNASPMADDDSYSVAEDGVLNVSPAGVLVGDTDSDGDPLTAILFAGQFHGTLTLRLDGSFDYAPDPDFFGVDSFTYRANDGVSFSNTATVIITVTPVNDDPVAADDAYSVVEDGGLIMPAGSGLVANDQDADGDGLSAVLVDPPANGTLSLAGDGSFDYTPDPDFFGVDSFTYRASDGSSSSNTATVTITVTAVNDDPLAADDAYSVAEDGTLAVPLGLGLLANDQDADGDSVSTVLIDPPAHGILSLSGNGSFDYVPDPDFFGTDSFSYRASDGTASSNTATVTITVTPVNDDPVAADDAYSVAEDRTLNVPAALGLLANDADVEGDSLEAQLVSAPSHGRLLNLGQSGRFVYRPDPDFFGPDSFTYRASDGASSSNTATVTITVTAVNDDPLAFDDVFGAAEGTPLSIAPDVGLLGNDQDMDGDGLAVVLGGGPSNGVLSLGADGSFVYTPAPGFAGSDQFSYRVSDGDVLSDLATVTITVAPAPVVPVVPEVPVVVEGILTIAAPLANIVSPGPLDLIVSPPLLESVPAATPANDSGSSEPASLAAEPPPAATNQLGGSDAGTGETGALAIGVPGMAVPAPAAPGPPAPLSASMVDSVLSRFPEAASRLQSMARHLDAIPRQFDGMTPSVRAVIDSVVAGGVTAGSLAYLHWQARLLSLLGGLAVASPVFRELDPLVLLGAPGKRRRRDDDEESLATLVEGRQDSREERAESG